MPPGMYQYSIVVSTPRRSSSLVLQRNIVVSDTAFFDISWPRLLALPSSALLPEMKKMWSPQSPLEHRKYSTNRRHHTNVLASPGSTRSILPSRHRAPPPKRWAATPNSYTIAPSAHSLEHQLLNILDG